MVAIIERSTRFRSGTVPFGPQSRHNQREANCARTSGRRLPKCGQVAQVVERSPEKAGVGGSTPSLATIIPKDLGAFVHFLQPKVQPKVNH